MPECANKNCGVTCTLRFCDACYTAHQAKLTNECKTCKKKTFANREYCKTCEPQVARQNLCKQCNQTCRAGSTFCSDCREIHALAKKAVLIAVSDLGSGSTSGRPMVVLDKICEACRSPSDAKFCHACREAFRSQQRPCADCGVAMTNGRYCDKCIADYNANRTESKCNECSASIPVGKKFCSTCVAAFKANLHPCRNLSCTNITVLSYCDVCSSAHKSSATSLTT